MSSPKWIIETDIFEDDLVDAFIEAVRQQGLEVLLHDIKRTDLIPLLEDDCVIFRGSLQLGARIRRDKAWVPGVWCDLKNFACSKYYAYFGKYLLNSSYAILPYAEFKRLWKWLYHQWKGRGTGSSVFVRPDSGFKNFTGQLVYDGEWIDDVLCEDALCPPGVNFKSFVQDTEDFYGVDPHSLVVVSHPQVIDHEWRFVVCDHKVVAGSQYKQNGEINIQAGYSDEAIDLARKIAAEKWQPERAYTLDICDNAVGVYLVEINSFSCSAFYHCDPKPIVEAASRLAHEEWKEVNED